jgi:hypothetical protein
MPEVGSRVQISSAPKAWSCVREIVIGVARRSPSAAPAIEGIGTVASPAAKRVVRRACARRAGGIERRQKDAMIIAITSEIGALVCVRLERAAWVIILPKF